MKYEKRDDWERLRNQLIHKTFTVQMYKSSLNVTSTQ